LRECWIGDTSVFHGSSALSLSKRPRSSGGLRDVRLPRALTLARFQVRFRQVDGQGNLSPRLCLTSSLAFPGGVPRRTPARSLALAPSLSLSLSPCLAFGFVPRAPLLALHSLMQLRPRSTTLRIRVPCASRPTLALARTAPSSGRPLHAQLLLPAALSLRGRSYVRKAALRARPG